MNQNKAKKFTLSITATHRVKTTYLFETEVHSDEEAIQLMRDLRKCSFLKGKKVGSYLDWDEVREELKTITGHDFSPCFVDFRMEVCAFKIWSIDSNLSVF